MIRTSPALAEELTPFATFEAFRARVASKTGWTRAKAGKLGEGVLESTEDDVPAWRGSIEVTGVTKVDAMAIIKLLFGEELFIGSSSIKNSFTMSYELNDDSAKRKQGSTMSSSGEKPRTSSVPFDKPPRVPTNPLDKPRVASNPTEKQRSGRNLFPAELTKTLSSSSRTSQATTPSGVFGSASDNDENTSEDEDGKEGTEGGIGDVDSEKVSFRRRISRIATARLRRSLRSPKAASPDAVRNRRLRFIRHIFEDCVVAMDDDGLLEPFEDEMDNVKRVRLNMMGAMVTERPNGNGVRVNFLVDLDPAIEKWEQPMLKPEVVSECFERGRVEELLMRFVSACAAISSSRMGCEMLRHRQEWTGDSVEGEAWTSSWGRESLIVGCLVKHPQLGPGNIESFDMRGTFKVKYENGGEVAHQPEDRDKVKMVLSVGNRVRHRSKGLGTVQCIFFDEITVRYDDGRMRKYAKDAWYRRLRRVIDEDDPLLRFSWAAHSDVREGIARVQFVVPDTTADLLLSSLLYRMEGVSEDEAAEVQERRLIRVANASDRTIFEQRIMPKPLTPRSFVTRVRHAKVMSAHVIHGEKIADDSVPDVQGIVRGYRICEGWVIEPIPLLSSCLVTHILCLDLSGFVPPESLKAVRDGILTSDALNLINDFRTKTPGTPTSASSAGQSPMASNASASAS